MTRVYRVSFFKTIQIVPSFSRPREDGVPPLAASLFSHPLVLVLRPKYEAVTHGAHPASTIHERDNSATPCLRMLLLSTKWWNVGPFYKKESIVSACWWKEQCIVGSIVARGGPIWRLVRENSFLHSMTHLLQYNTIQHNAKSRSLSLSWIIHVVLVGWQASVSNA